MREGGLKFLSGHTPNFHSSRRIIDEEKISEGSFEGYRRHLGEGGSIVRCTAGATVARDAKFGSQGRNRTSQEDLSVSDAAPREVRARFVARKGERPALLPSKNQGL